jgi:hypothetical protein
LNFLINLLLIQVATQSKAWVCGRSLAGIAASNPSGDMDIRQLKVLFFVRLKPLRRADHSSKGVLRIFDVPSECDRRVPYGEAMAQNRVEKPQKKTTLQPQIMQRKGFVRMWPP